MYTAFDPIFDEDSEILILGSFPSVKSRENCFYYGNPKNRFWETISTLFGIESLASTEDKTNFLLTYKIALWDIIQDCEIKGSLDSNLRNITVVDLYRILNVAKIKRIFCNGKTAYNLVVKFYPTLKNMTSYLPSTSPANISFSIDKWKEILQTWKN